MAHKTFVSVPALELGDKKVSQKFCKVIRAGEYDDPEKPSRLRNRGFGWTIVYNKKTDLVAVKMATNSPGTIVRNWTSFVDCIKRSKYAYLFPLFDRAAYKNELIFDALTQREQRYKNGTLAASKECIERIRAGYQGDTMTGFMEFFVDALIDDLRGIEDAFDNR